MRRSPRTLLTAAVLGVASLLTSPFAIAEDPDDWMMGGVDMWSSYSTVWQGPSLQLAAPQLERVAEVLNLDESQRDAMMDLYRGLQDEHLGSWVEFAEVMNDMQNKSMGVSTDWQEQQRQMQEANNAYSASQERLINIMLDDLRLLLTPEQDERWETLDRERYRMNSLTQWGCYPAERWDLIDVVNTLDLDGGDRSALDPILERYAEEMDGLLRSRNRQLESLGELYQEYSEIQQEQYGLDWEDPDAMTRYEEIQNKVMGMSRDAISSALEARPLCKRVADLNTRYADEVMPQLPDRDRREMEKMIGDESSGEEGMMWNPASYSRAKQKFATALNMQEMVSAYTTFASSMDSKEDWGLMRIARELEPLSARQISEIESLEEEFLAEYEFLEERRPGGAVEIDPEEMMKWSFTLRTPMGSMTLNHTDPPEDAMMGGKSGMAFYGGGFAVEMGKDGSDDEMQEWMERKADLEQRYIERLRDILTLRQRAMIAFN